MFRLVKECKREELNDQEKFAIGVAFVCCEKFGSVCFNVKMNGSFVRTQEHRENIGLGNTGKVRSQENKDRISKSLKDHYSDKPNPFKGKTHKAESKKRMSEAKMGKKWTEAQYKARGLSQ